MIACITQFAKLAAPASIHVAPPGVPIVLVGLALAVGTIVVLVLLRRQLLRALLLVALFAMVLAPAVLLFRNASGRRMVNVTHYQHQITRLGEHADRIVAEVGDGIGDISAILPEEFRSAIQFDMPLPSGRLNAFASSIDRPLNDEGRSWLKRILSFGAVGLFLFLTYLFFDSGTRGQFTWPLRFLSVLAFIGICVTIASIGPLR